MDFIDVIDSEINKLQIARDKIEQAVKDPNWYANKTYIMVNSVTKQLTEIVSTVDMDKDDLLSEFKSVLDQLPQFVGSICSSTKDDLEAVDKDILTWNRFANLYREWTSTNKTPAAIEEDVVRIEEKKKDIKSGSLQEPSVTSGRKRKVGARPPITLRRYRELAEELESDEDSEA
jgi:hypothetical protein